MALTGFDNEVLVNTLTEIVAVDLAPPYTP